MADDPLAEILRMVADGHLTAEEAAPLIDALDARSRSAGPTGAPAASDDPGTRASSDRQPPRALRVQVSDHGRNVLNLRIPLALGRAGLDQVPGISRATSERIREAIAAGTTGPILDVDDAGSGVRISIE